METKALKKKLAAIIADINELAEEGDSNAQWEEEAAELEAKIQESEPDFRAEY